MRHCIRVVMTVLLVYCSLAGGPLWAVAQGNVVGTVYTSPTYDVQLQWSEPWFYIEDASEEGVDTLLISNGPSDANFLLVFAPGVTLAGLLEAAMSEPMEGVSNVKPLLDEQGNPVAGADGDREWAVLTGIQTFDDGSTIDFMQYFDLHQLEGGVIVLMTGVTVSYFWDDNSVNEWNELAATVVVGPTPDPEPTAAPPFPNLTPTPTPLSQRGGFDPTPTPEPIETPGWAPAPASDGGPAPAFAAGPWRIAVRAVDLGESIDYLGLEFTEGMQWVVVYADITNWSAEEQTLAVEEMTLVTATGPVSPDPAGTQSAATLLGLEPANGGTVSVPAGSAVRVALVYAIPASETDLVLAVAGTQLPLDDAVGQQFDVTDLSTIATPPSTQTGVLATRPGIGEAVLQFSVDTGNGPQPIQLAGVAFPADADCFEPALVTMSTSGLGGSNVRIETDPALSSLEGVYVWIENPRGEWELLNQTLLAKGIAIEGDLPESARFGAWLEETDAVAEANGAGLWATCAGEL